MTTYNSTFRGYTSRLYSRGLLDTDVEHVKRILYDWEDWPLTDEKAESLTRVWAKKTSFWQAPFFEGMERQEVTTLFCLKSNNLPVVINRGVQQDTTHEDLFTATCPDHRNQGYAEEASKLNAIVGWNYFNLRKSVLSERVDMNSLLGAEHPRNNITGTIETAKNRYTMPDMKKTQMTIEQWNVFKNSSIYSDWAIEYTLYPVYPGDPL